MATPPSPPADPLPRSPAHKRARIVYTALLAVAGCALLWSSFVNTASLVLGRKNPALVMRLGYSSAEAKAALAFSMASNKPGIDQIRQARQLAQAALRHEPVNATAAVSLGILATLENRMGLARSLITYSEHVSRRNTVAQLWMIEDRVARGDAAGALVHYDRVMSVSPGLRPVLIPILVQASANPVIARPLAAMLARRPAWWSDALVAIIYQGTAPAVTLPILLQPLKLRPGNDGERVILAAAMQRLADAGALEQAAAFYRAAGGRPAHGNFVRDGDFESDSPLLPPFDWKLHDDAGLAATVQPRNGQGRALFLSIDQEHRGELARQLLLLKPGRYHFAALAGSISGDTLARPQVRLSCAATGSGAVLDLRLGVAGEEGARATSDFTIPASNCPGQWLSIASGSPEQAPEAEAWIDDISIRPVG